ncbi:uncharacterized protein CANTADRAFT_27440 [Suhomyces tanzawaensis NRRL Y-17324]|uniref:Uncharacterized protein n=1 Tax=Suhomyces tanzawaensis NRRL Y-17324 TaxID=984487 RepID=A0A1E4SBY0_9ASCO|nr:uncharacterized protein CANTADRAFT_27440 [Suhomyces tanzawaensis NRRL Y-17324]ODV77040.1 hypothetical protein CANTADRAFT_27440 [Suhomyces tanzawaensis NRRL Y-17324]
MAVYGKSRKRARLSSQTPIFSSDDESSSNTPEVLTSVVNDDTTTTTEQLMPSAPFQTKRISPRKPTSDFFEDSLTTSPRKLKSLLGDFGSPRGPRPKSLHEELTFLAQQSKLPEKEPSRQLNHNSNAPSTPSRKGRSSTNSPFKKHSSIPSTPITPKEKDAWNSLFENIAKDGLPTKYVSSEEETEEPLHLAHINSIYEKLEQEAIPGEERQTVSEARKSRLKSSSLVYGEERSFLLKEDDDHPPLAEQELSDSKEVSNIHDLRTLGMTNRERDSLNYILDGLHLKRASKSKILEANSMLVSTLLDIVLEEEVSKILRMNSMVACDRLLSIYSKLAKSQDELKDLIQWLIAICLYDLTKNSPNSKEVTTQLNQYLFDILKILAKDVSTTQLLKILTARINKVKQRIQPKSAQVSLISAMQSESAINNWELFEIAGNLYLELDFEEDKLAILNYFDGYLTSKKFFESLGILSILIPSTIESIPNFEFSETEAQLLNIIMILLANYNDNNEVRKVLYCNEYIPKLIQVVNYCLKLVKSSKAAERDTNILLMLLTLLINIPEAIEVELELFDDINKNIQLILSLGNAEDDLVKHFIGYNLIFVGYVRGKYKEKVEIDELDLLDRLKTYGQDVDGLQGRIGKVTEALLQ